MKELLENLFMSSLDYYTSKGIDGISFDEWYEQNQSKIDDAVGECLKSIDEDLYECFLITKEIKKDTVGFKWFMRWYRIKDTTQITQITFGLDSTLYDDLKSIREEKDQMVEKGILK